MIRDTPITKLEKKAAIVAERLTGVGTVKTIAENYDTSERSVYRYTEEATKDPDLLALSLQLKEKIVEQSKRNVVVGLDIMHERMQSPSSKLHEITGAVKISHDILQLQTNQPTSITQTTASPVDQAISYARLLLQKLEIEEARAVYFANEKMRRIVGADAESWAGAWVQAEKS